MKKINALFLALGMMSSVHALAAETLRYGLESQYAPFESRNAQGELEGFDIELGKAICATGNFNCQWVESSFDALIPALQAKKFDAILSAMSMTEKRREQVDFSAMIYNTPSALLTPKNSALTDDIRTLRGKSVGVAQGTIQETYAKAKWAAQGVNIVSYPNQMEIYPDLVAGRLDASLANAVSAAQGFLNTPEGKNYAIQATLVDKELLGNGVGIGLRKGDAASLKLINDALAQLHANGTYDRLAKKYFAFKVYP